MNWQQFNKTLAVCTCGLLIVSSVASSLIEIVDCPIHGKVPCTTPHTEATLVSLGSINQGTDTPPGSVHS